MTYDVIIHHWNYKKIDKVGLDPCLKVSKVGYMEISYYNGLYFSASANVKSSAQNLANV